MKFWRGSLNFLVFFFGLFFLITFFVWWRWGNQPKCYPKENNKCPEIKFSIVKGSGLNKISSDLFQKGLVKSSLIFKIQVLKTGLGPKIQAGEFFLSPAETPLEIAEKLTRGRFDKKITVIEGWRAEEIGEYLVKEGININLAEWKKEITQRGIEGYLFPDTYFISKNASPQKIIDTFTANFRKNFSEELKMEAQKKGINEHQVVILASLIEREVSQEKDRPIVAGILLKRLAKGWPLQVDASLQYVIANERCFLQSSKCEWWPKKISQNDKENKSPYNTYLYKGLPPGPICNPGLSAIKAVVFFQESPYWFYLSDSLGNIHYAKTFEDHQKNVKYYLKQGP